MKTKIILQEDIPNLGTAGDLKEVAPGYARNYLFPHRMAVPASSRSRALWDAKKEQVQAERASKLLAAQERAKSIQDSTITLARRAGQDGKLYGSVTPSDVAEAFATKSQILDRRWIELREAIRTTGEFVGAVRIHPQVRATFKILVQAAG